MLLKARFDKVGKFTDRITGIQKDAKTAHYIIGNTDDEVSGGLYLPVGMEFPAEGITIKKEGR